MKNFMVKTFIATIICLSTGGAFAKPPSPTPKRDESIETESTRKKKQPGEECQNSDECRHHHRCKQIGEIKVCVAPEPHEIPKT